MSVRPAAASVGVSLPRLRVSGSASRRGRDGAAKPLLSDAPERIPLHCNSIVLACYRTVLIVVSGGRRMQASPSPLHQFVSIGESWNIDNS